MKIKNKTAKLAISAIMILSILIGLNIATVEAETNYNLGLQNSGDGLFDSPYNMTIESSGIIYVIEISNHSIQKISIIGESEPGGTKTMPTDTTSQNGVQLKTDNTSYYQGELVNITLKNNYPNTVHIITGSNACDKFRIYSVENSTYVDLIGEKMCAAVILEEDVPSGGTIERVWDQKDGHGNQVPIGRYRAEIANYSSDNFTITN